MKSFCIEVYRLVLIITGLQTGQLLTSNMHRPLKATAPFTQHRQDPDSIYSVCINWSTLIQGKRTSGFLYFSMAIAMETAWTKGHHPSLSLPSSFPLPSLLSAKKHAKFPCLSVCLLVCLSVYPSVNLSLLSKIAQHACKCRSTFLCVCLSVGV